MTRPLPAAPCLVALVLAATGSAATPLPVCPVWNGKTVSYDIMRGGGVIGHQTMRYAVAGPNMTVTTDITAALSALGVRVYRYEHHGEERWHDGQMVAMATRTDDDGTPRHVDAARDPETGAWHGVVGASPGLAPLMSSSLWNIQTVAQTRLLDRETGEAVPVHAGLAESQVLELGGKQVVTTKYDLTGPAARGTVWYDGSGCLVQALFHTKVDGSLIELRAH